MSEVALLAAATAASAAGSISAGNAQARAANFQAAVQRQQAERQRQLAAVQEAQLRVQQQKNQGTRRALLAARGIHPAAGTALLTLEQAEAENEFNALLQRSNADFRAVQSEQDARLSLMRGSAARNQGFFSVGTKLLNAGSTLARK